MANILKVVSNILVAYKQIISSQTSNAYQPPKVHPIQVKVKGKAIPVTGREGP
jgi:hypothetical protein